MLCELLVVAATLLSDGEAVPAASGRSFYVIVNRANPATSIRRGELSAIFMRRQRRWPHGTQVIAVDQLPRSRVRELFSRAVHGKSVAYVTRYWHRVIFAGRGIPPPELASDDAVIALVRREAGAVGYIDSETPVDESVRIIAVRP